MLDPVPATVGLVVLLALSGFFSGAETALIAANRYRISYLARHGDRRAQRVRALVEDRERLLSTILVGNNFVNIAASALATTVAIRFAGDNGPIYATIVMTVVILIFAEIAPKTLAARIPEQFSCFVSAPVTLLVKLLYPVATATNAIAHGLLLLFGKGDAASTAVSEEDIKGMIALGGEDDSIAHDKRRMLSGVFRLTDLAIEDVMIPRTRVVALDIDTSPDEIIQVIRESGYTRFPVCRGTLDEVVGVLNSKDVLRHSEELDKLDIQKLTRKPLFIPESAPLQAMLHAFQEQRQHMAIVIDEYGGVEGIVSLEDLLEEIVGEIDDEFDVPRIPQVAELTDGSLRVAGSCPLTFLTRRYGLKLEASESTTLAGFILELTGRIPEPGERISHQGLELIIERAMPHRVDQVRIDGVPPFDADG